MSPLAPARRSREDKTAQLARRRDRSFAPAPGEKVADQGQSTRNRQQKDLFEKGAAAYDALALPVRLYLALSQQHAKVLGKIHSALFALAALCLHVLAGGAGVAQRSMAAGAELRRFRVGLSAPRTLHTPF